MNTKVDFKINELVSIFSKKTGWNLARVRFLSAFICSLCKLQTVCYVKLAQDLSGKAKVESNLRRIQRFFAKFIVDEDLIAKIIFSMLPTEPPYRLSLDRTNWKFGTTNINILMISVCYNGVGIPLIWTMLNKRGNSNTKERKDLLERYISLFGTVSIESIGADREFIGDDWIADLIRTIGRTNKIEFVIIATYNYTPDALTIYRDRWQIETMFRALKSSGFNFEDTHLTDIDRISKLLSIMCIAFIWAYRVGIYKDKNIAPIKIKKHGRRAYSFFKYGLIFIAHALLCNVYQNIELIIEILSCT